MFHSKYSEGYTLIRHNVNRTYKVNNCDQNHRSALLRTCWSSPRDGDGISWRCCSGTSHDAWNLEVGHLQLSRSPSHSWNRGWVYWWGFSVVTFGHTKSNRAALICVYITSLTTQSRAEFPGMDSLNWDQPVTTPASPLKQEDVAIVRLTFYVNGVVLFAFM